jgi:hypothetical protein
MLSAGPYTVVEPGNFCRSLTGNFGIAATAVTPAACLIHSRRVIISTSPPPIDSNGIQHWYA